MKTLKHLLLPLIGMLALGNALAAGSLLRIACDGESRGANVTVNGKFKGQCPIDVMVTEGTQRLLVEKQFGQEAIGTYTTELRIGDGVVQKIDVTLEKKLTEFGKRAAAENHKKALEAYQRETEEHANRLAARNGAVRLCVEDMETKAQEKGQDCYFNSGGCVGGLFCETYKERKLRCYGDEYGRINTAPFEAICQKRYPEPRPPAPPPGLSN